MSIRITYVNYTDSALEAIIRNMEDRSIAIKSAVESAGGKFIGFYGLIGQDFEVMIISEFEKLTDYMSVIASAIINRGITDIKTVHCYTGEDVKIAATKALSGEIKYKAADS